MRKVRLALLAAAGVAISGGPAGSADFTIELPPLADVILNGNTTQLDPELMEALEGDFSFALGITIGSAFASENLQLAEAFSSAVVVQQGPGSAEVESVVETFTSPDLARVRSWLEGQATSRGPQITAN